MLKNLRELLFCTNENLGFDELVCIDVEKKIKIAKREQ